jgi:hypothetical protein
MNVWEEKLLKREKEEESYFKNGPVLFLLFEKILIFLFGICNCKLAKQQLQNSDTNMNFTASSKF